MFKLVLVLALVALVLAACAQQQPEPDTSGFFARIAAERDCLALDEERVDLAQSISNMKPGSDQHARAGKYLEAVKVRLEALQCPR